MRVVLTRPAADAQTWMDAFKAAGHEVVALPLIEIKPASNAPLIQEAWALWPNWQAVMFVSAQAVRHFFEHRPNEVPSFENGPRCWATGPGTHKALLQAGVPTHLIDSPSADAAQFDSEALWECVRERVLLNKSVLIVRGQDESSGTGRDWLANQLKTRGADVQSVVAYERCVPSWSPDQLSMAQAAAQGDWVWCFSSSQALQNLQRLLPLQNWAQMRCIVTHPRIAQTAATLGFGLVKTAKPSVNEVLASLESLA